MPVSLSPTSTRFGASAELRTAATYRPLLDTRFLSTSLNVARIERIRGVFADYTATAKMVMLREYPELRDRERSLRDYIMQNETFGRAPREN